MLPSIVMLNLWYMSLLRSKNGYYYHHNQLVIETITVISILEYTNDYQFCGTYKSIRRCHSTDEMLSQLSTLRGFSVLYHAELL